MQADVQVDGAYALAGRILDRIQNRDGTVLADLRFLAAWDRGLAALPGSILRLHRLRRANPAGAAAGRHPNPAATDEASAAPPVAVADAIRAGDVSWRP